MCTLFHSTSRWAISHNTTLFVSTLYHYTELFHVTLHHLCVRCATRHYPVLFDATLHCLFTVLQMSAKLFVIELVHFTISCSNSTWATRPFIIWLNYSCLGCSVSWRKTKPSIIWPCHSFISYSILQLILKPALYLLIYLTSLYFWWWRPPILFLSAKGDTVVCKISPTSNWLWLFDILLAINYLPLFSLGTSLCLFRQIFCQHQHFTGVDGFLKRLTKNKSWKFEVEFFGN